MESLTLPEPAKSLFEKTHDLLDRHLNRITPRGTAWAVGGGTILAARWKHRRSRDLDLVLPERARLNRLSEGTDSRFARDMLARGAVRIDWDWKELKRVHFPTGKIDIVAMQPTPSLGQRRFGIGTSEADVLTNAQILSGKLMGRSLRAPVRDVFDTAVAAREDPEALRIAVNTVPEAVYERIERRWEAGRASYEHDAKHQLIDVPQKYGAEKADPVERASRALKELRYHLIEIEITERGIETRTENAAGRTETVYPNAERARAGFEESGLNAALEAWDIDAARTRKLARGTLAAGMKRVIVSRRSDKEHQARHWLNGTPKNPTEDAP